MPGSRKRFYHVCSLCETKFFSPRSLEECPRLRCPERFYRATRATLGRYVGPFLQFASGFVAAKRWSHGQRPERTPRGRRAFRCIYADLTWADDDRASPGASASHRPIMKVDEILSIAGLSTG